MSVCSLIFCIRPSAVLCSSQALKASLRTPLHSSAKSSCWPYKVHATTSHILRVSRGPTPMQESVRDLQANYSPGAVCNAVAKRPAYWSPQEPLALVSSFRFRAAYSNHRVFSCGQLFLAVLTSPISSCTQKLLNDRELAIK